MKIKICGIKDLKIAQTAVQAGADMLGLVFAKSKRQIDIATARLIRSNLPKTLLVGVFKNQPLEEILTICEQVGLDIVQLHGDEPPEFLASIKLPVFRSVAVQQDGMCDFAFERWRGVKAFLLDRALNDGSSGGAGKVFDWCKFYRAKSTVPIIVAGGLNPDNVAQAIEALHPYAVDVSGGVEANGEKSSELIEKFIEKVRGMDNA